MSDGRQGLGLKAPTTVDRGFKMEWKHAYSIAQEISEHLKPHVIELKCVGSVRRKKPEVGDIEFVCRPQMQTDLVGGAYPILDVIEKALGEIGTRRMGDQRLLAYGDIYGFKGLKLDLFVCWPPASFGSLVAIRTGPWELSKHAMTMLDRNGYKHTLGHIERKDTGAVVAADTEERFFELAGIPCVVPSKRQELIDTILKGGRV